MKEYGFILRRFLPQKCKFSVLSHRGKLDIVPNQAALAARLWPGMLVSFDLRPTNRIFFVNYIEILDMPIGEELKWVHSLLELIYYFAPLNSPATNTFNILQRALSFVHLDCYFADCFEIVKKLFIVALLDSFGFYPDKLIFKMFKEFNRLVLVSVDFPNARAIESLQQELYLLNSQELGLIDSWIRRCVLRHPNAQFFRTIGL